MNKDNIEGGLRKTAGQVEEFAGRSTKNKQMTGEGLYDQAAGTAQSAYGQAKDSLEQTMEDMREISRETAEGDGLSLRNHSEASSVHMSSG